MKRPGSKRLAAHRGRPRKVANRPGGITLNGKRPWLLGLAWLALTGVEASVAAGWSAYGPVKELRPTTSGRFLVRLDVASTPGQCKKKQWFFRDYTGTGADHMFRALLAAATSGKRVRVYATGRCDLQGYSEISSASIIP